MKKKDYKMIRVHISVYEALQKKKQYPTQSFSSLFASVFMPKPSKKINKKR